MSVEVRPLLLVMTNCVDPAREAACVDWYDNVHLPDACEVPGVRRVVRHSLIGAPQTGAERAAQHLMFNDLGAADPVAVLPAILALAPQWRAAGRMFDGLQLVDLATYEPLQGGQLVIDETTPARAIYIAMVNCTDPAREDEFNDWASGTHIGEVLERPHFLRAGRYRMLGEPKEGQARYLHLYELDTDDLDRVHADVVAAGLGGRARSRIDCVASVYVAYYRIETAVYRNSGRAAWYPLPAHLAPANVS